MNTSPSSPTKEEPRVEVYASISLHIKRKGIDEAAFQTGAVTINIPASDIPELFEKLKATAKQVEVDIGWRDHRYLHPIPVKPE